MKFGILTVSTTCSLHPEKDLAGPKLKNEIKQYFPQCQVTFKQIVTDDKDKIAQILMKVANEILCDVLFTVGGTGFAPSDVTPEATKMVVDKEAPGLAYAMISKSLAVTDMAVLSRPICGIKNKTIIVNLPGSAKAAAECFGFIRNSLSHAVALVKDEIDDVKRHHQEIQNPEGEVTEESKVKIRAGARPRNSPYPMIEVDQAFEIILRSLPEPTQVEIVPIDQALTRILAEDVKAPKPVPAFPASVKDGYAVRAADGEGRRKVRSSLAAGDRPINTELQPGEIIRISTGAPVPAGADAVVQVENTTLVKVTENGEEEEIVDINVAPQAGQDIRQIGSDIAANTTVLTKFKPISAAYIGVLAMLGYSEVKVLRRAHIGVVSTGNEIVTHKETLKPGQIYDSNKITLLSLLETHGYEAVDCGIARDIPNSVKRVLEQAFENNDVIVSSGGVSMSEFDLLKEVLIEDFGAKIHFGRVNMKPGKPTVFATVNYKGHKKLVFALPGNPVSCCVTALLYVIQTLKIREGNELFRGGWPNVTVTMDHDIVNSDQRPEYVRLTVYNEKNVLRGKSTGNQTSSRLNSMVDANALLVVPGKSIVSGGSSQSVLVFGQIIS